MLYTYWCTLAHACSLYYGGWGIRQEITIYLKIWYCQRHTKIVYTVQNILGDGTLSMATLVEVYQSYSSAYLVGSRSQWPPDWHFGRPPLYNSPVGERCVRDRRKLSFNVWLPTLKTVATNARVTPRCPYKGKYGRIIVCCPHALSPGCIELRLK